MAIGIASAILIFLYIRHELRYDTYHDNADRIYRIVRERDINGDIRASVGQPLRMGPDLAAEFSEIENVTRFFRLHQETPLVASGERRFYEKRFFFTDSEVFDIFSFQLDQGNPETALNAPFSVVLTRDMAIKYFGDENKAIGRQLTLQNQFQLNVTGVLADIPDYSHFKFDFLVNYEGLESLFFSNLVDTWVYNPCVTYLLLAPGASPSALADGMAGFVARNIDERNKKLYHSIDFQPLADIHLNSNADSEIEPNSAMLDIYILSIIGALILLIAAINFINLTTARGVLRAKEVGVRKTLGARRKQLVFQFLTGIHHAQFYCTLPGMDDHRAYHTAVQHVYRKIPCN